MRRVEQKSYEMPPRDGFTVTHFITVADIDRSADFYEKVFGGRILSRGDSKGASGHIQIANTWLIVNVGGRAHPGQAVGDAQQLPEYPRCGYSSVL
jgi:predicted enzyme related to lactoylglutathione lyase